MAIRECPPTIEEIVVERDIETFEDPSPLGPREDSRRIDLTPRAVGKVKHIVDSMNYMTLPEGALRQAPTPFLSVGFSDISRARIDASSEQWRDYSKGSGDGTRVEDRFRYESRSFWKTTTNASGEDNFEYTLNESAFRKTGERFINNNNNAFFVEGVGQPRPLFLGDVNSPLYGLSTIQTIQIKPNTHHFHKRRDSEEIVLVDELNPAGPSTRYIPSIAQNWKFWVQGESAGIILNSQYLGLERGINFYPNELFKRGQFFLDHSYKINAPMFPKELEKINNINRPAIISAESEYNFRIQEYENIIQSSDFGFGHESLLPNMYIMILGERERGGRDSFLNQHVTLQGRVRDVFLDYWEPSSGQDRGQYFEKWSMAYKVARNPGFRDRQYLMGLMNRSRSLVFSPNDLDILNSFNEKRFLFPMYVEFQFSTDRATSIADSMKESQLITSLMQTVKAVTAIELDFTTATQTIASAPNTITNIEVLKKTKRKVLDISQWWSTLSNSINSENDGTGNSNTLTLLSNSLPEIFMSSQNNYNFIKTILSVIFSGKLRQIVKEKNRTFEEVMAGKPAYSETLFYKVCKYNTDRNGNSIGDPIQEFFIPNSSDLNIFRYIDTQVVYGKRYSYRVYAYQFVIGTKYQYQDYALDGNKCIFEVLTEPSVQLIETPIVRFISTVLDKPPLPPEVNIIPYRNVNNKILFNFNTNFGEETAVPVVFNSQEAAHIARIKEKSDLGPSDPIEYKTDDGLENIKVYRTTFKPQKYLDFANFLHKTVETRMHVGLRDGTDIRARSIRMPAVSLVDDLVPNVKYYYTFRSTDVRNHVSNPTPVYLVELVSQDGVTFPRIKLFDMEPEVRPRSIKKVQKYVKIEPSVIQKALDVSNINDIDTASDAQVVLGDIEDSLFVKDPDKRKIKLRLTSKRTGKKIDINLNFSHKHDR